MATQSRIGWRPYVNPFTPEDPGTPNTIDQDVTNFILTSGISDSVQISAIETLVSDLKAYGLWTKMKALYPFVGGSAASHKFNLKDPRDLNAAYRLVFNGGWVHSSNGAQPNGTTGYADSKYNPYINGQLNSAHISYYSRTNSSSSNAIDMGALSATPGNYHHMHIRYTGDLMFGLLNTSSAISVSNNISQGLFISSRINNTNVSLYRNNSNIGNVSLNSSTQPSNNIYIGAGNITNLPQQYSSKESSFISIGDGLTDTEATNFYISVQKFQTTLGRHVGTPYVSDTDAIAFLMAAGITDGTQAAAINTLVIRMKADGVWTKMKAIYPFIGGSATSHKFNLKDPRDLDAAYRLVFNGGSIHNSTGYVPNLNSYADTKLNPSTVLNIDSVHFSYYSRTNSMVNNYDMGVTISSVPVLSLTATLRWGDGVTYYSMGFNPTEVNKIQTSTDKNFIFNKITTSASLFENTTKTTTSVTNRSGLPNGNFFIAARNLDGTAQQSPQRNCAFSSIGDGLTDAEVTAFYNAVQAYQTTLGRQVNVPLVSDTDAQTFLNAANITSFQQASAVNKLVINLKAAGVWSKMKAIYPFVGGSATSHKWNLKDPRDLDAAYRLVFNGGWIHSSTGAKPNGTNGYANTYLVPSTRYTDSNSISIGFYSRTNISENSNDIGSMQSTLTSIGIQTRWTDNKIYGVCYDDSVRAIIVNNLDSTGFFTLSRTTTTSLRLYKNETTLGSYTNTVTGSLPTAQINLGSYNGLVNFSTREQALAFIGDGLSETETLSFYAAVQTYQTSLGRAVNTPVYNNNLVLNLDAGNANSYSGTGTTWFDLSSGNNGTLVNGPTYDATSGGSILFDGTNDYANFGNVQSLNSLTSGVTIGAWIKSSSTTTYSAILQKWYQSGMQGGFQLFISSGGILTLAIGDFITGYSGGSSTVSVITGSWVYVTATYDMNAIKIYINGVLNSTTSLVRSVVNSNNATLFLGQDDYGGRFFRGNISSATVHNRALTATEILNNFNSTRGRFGL